MLRHFPWNPTINGDLHVIMEHSSIPHVQDAHMTIHRHLEDDSSTATVGSTWEMIYVGCVLILMFAALLSERIGADMVMLSALTMCMAANIITVAEGISGFSNEGVLTVVVLFVVAAGIQMTGSLDWYMGKLLGRPKSTAAAQIRLVAPIAFISAFLNNTPVVVVMIPIVQKWSKTIGVSPAQLLIPLSFASILGGTCTLIGTSTNLVVKGLLDQRYPNDPNMAIGLFDLGEFGVPIAIIGTAYILIASAYLLPGGKRGRKDGSPVDEDGPILLGARLTRWSPAVGRSVKRSGLRDTGGIYLVSVYRAATGNVHRAVGQEFVLNVDDVLYFTGLVEEFGDFCANHGLEVVTSEVDIANLTDGAATNERSATNNEDGTIKKGSKTVKFVSTPQSMTTHVSSFDESNQLTIETRFDAPAPISTRRSNHISERLQAINRMSDMIRGYTSSEMLVSPLAQEDLAYVREATSLTGPAKIVVFVDTQTLPETIIVGVNAEDRPGLLLQISRGLHSLDLQLHHTEACVLFNRSISVWRCEAIESNPSAEVVSALFNELMRSEAGAEAVKRRGLSVIRAVVTEQSQLCGITAKDVNFRVNYKAAIIGVQKADKSEVAVLSNVSFQAGDVLVLQVNEDSPLLVRPPDGFYDEIKSNKGFFSLFSKKLGSSPPQDTDEKDTNHSTDLEGGAASAVNASDNETQQFHDAWRDLRVLFHGNSDTSQQEVGITSREYLAAMRVCPKSPHINKTVTQAGLDKLTSLFLVQVERPLNDNNSSNEATRTITTSSNAFRTDIVDDGDIGSITGSIIGSQKIATIPLPPDGILQEGDILWFAGPVGAIADLMKIPGLVSTEDHELKQMEEKVHDRRLVQAVVARKGPLVGKTAAEVEFRTRYGAAVIAVHRDGTRVHDHPGNIKFQAGDVLLLEAGPSFISRHSDNQHSFALISEVKDSKPPRLNKLIPAITLVVAMLAVVTAGISSLLVCGLITSIIMVCLGILSQQECRDAVNWDVYVTIACAFGIGIALTNSGLANLIATGLVSLGEALGIGVAGLYGAVYLATFLISNVVTNNAAAALMFPIAMEASDKANADAVLMSYNLMLAASASFMSPFGYTTNLLVYGPGGYTVKDFLYFGSPLQVILWILTTVMLSITTPAWYLSWIISSALLLFVLIVLTCPSLIKRTIKSGKDNHGD